MPSLLRPTPSQGALVLSLFLTFTAPALAIEWQAVEQITHNGLEDRTTSGSLLNNFGMTVVWMQKQSAPGWKIMYSDLGGSGWTQPLPVDPSGLHPDYEPRVAGDFGRHVVWQRGVGDASEIMYASGNPGSAWTVEPITINGTEDLTPDVEYEGASHVVWAGYDPISGTGKIFHAVRGAGGWQVERLAGSELGPFWTGATPKVAVNYSGIVHVVYRGGDFGDYHAHYARKQNGVWTYQVLTSGNGNDLVADVATDGFDPVVAMSGNDGFGFPSRIYYRYSPDTGLTFQPHVLASGGFSASLNAVTLGPFHGINLVGSEVSGNIYTGNLVIWSEYFGGSDLLPPANQASSDPAIENVNWITAEAGGFFQGEVASSFTNDGGAGPDSAEVYVLATPPPGAVANGPAPSAGASLRVTPNPSRGIATITALGSGGHPRLSIYDPMGRLVRTILPADAMGAAATFRWDGRSAHGTSVPGGVYFLRLDGATSEPMTRLTIVR